MSDLAKEVEGYVTVEQAAILAGRSPSTIWRLASQGKIRTKRVLGRTLFNEKDAKKVREG
jgi:hypothetical protein